MNKIISILICCFIAGCLFVSCEQPDIPDVPNYDKTEILTFKVYNQDKEEVGTPVILSDEGVVTITVDEGTNLSNVSRCKSYYFNFNNNVTMQIQMIK